MLEASFALMNQYSAITGTNLAGNPTTPPIVIPSGDSILATENRQAKNETKEKVAAKVSLSTTDNMPGTSADAIKRNHQEDLIKIEDLGSEDQDDDIRNYNLGETSEANELRRRRLQKFLQTQQKNE